MNETEFALLVAAVLFLLAAIFFFLYIRQNKKILKLKNSIDEFIKSGKSTDFSVSENRFAMLQNSVADLESIINLEQSNRLSEARKNTEFISDISHQLKTPIAGLRLYCEMEKSVSKTEYTQKQLQLIDRMENLIQKLIRLEKIKSDSYVMDFQSNRICEIAESLIAEFRHLFPNKNYQIKGKSMLRCDRAWLSEAIGNIIKNASEHTPENGTVSVIIDGNAHSTSIEISDNGGGIREEEIPNLFVRFYRADTSNPNSAGIGLAITKAIVEKHHGIINAENKNGGLSVTMCFPHLDGYEAI